MWNSDYRNLGAGWVCEDPLLSFVWWWSPPVCSPAGQGAFIREPLCFSREWPSGVGQHSDAWGWASGCGLSGLAAPCGQALEEAMAPHPSTPAWKIPWTEKPGGPQSMGSLRVGHDWATSLSLFTFMHWRRKWQPTPVFLPGESQGQGSLVGRHLWGRTESDTTKVT